MKRYIIKSECNIDGVIGPITSPIEIPFRTVLKMVNRGVNVYEVNPLTNEKVKISIRNINGARFVPYGVTVLDKLKQNTKTDIAPEITVQTTHQNNETDTDKVAKTAVIIDDVPIIDNGTAVEKSTDNAIDNVTIETDSDLVVGDTTSIVNDNSNKKKKNKK